MGDHRASIKIEMEFHGIKDKCDMWINYYPHECCGMDKRVIEFFESVYERGMHVYDGLIADAEKDQREKSEREELARLEQKYRPHTPKP